MQSFDLDDRSLLQAFIGDGRPLIILTGFCLVLAGGVALFQSATGHFLPHDVEYLGMTAEELRGYYDGRIVSFMFHDRVSFGGVLIALGALYMWLAEFPLRRREEWAWWVLLMSGTVGFCSFLTYLSYGYLDSWHGVATLALLPLFVVGIARSFSTINKVTHVRCLLKRAAPVRWKSPTGLGQLCLLALCCGIIGAGFTIMTVGMTLVFVPQDLEYMQLRRDDLHAINERLVPLIAHDRAGFGGGLCSGGLAMLLSVWCAKPSKHLWQILGFTGTVGFSTAIGIHPIIGYTDFLHLAPVYFGALLLVVGLTLCYRHMHSNGSHDQRVIE